MNDMPDATMVAFFRECLRKAGEIKEMLERYLRGQDPKPVVIKSLILFLFLSQNNITSENRAKPSKLITC